MSADDAKKRVDDVMGQIDAAKQKAADAAETARKAAVIAAFITAASLLVAAVGAYWAAMMGGNHRDKADRVRLLVPPLLIARKEN